MEVMHISMDLFPSMVCVSLSEYSLHHQATKFGLEDITAIVMSSRERTQEQCDSAVANVILYLFI